MLVTSDKIDSLKNTVKLDSWSEERIDGKVVNSYDGQVRVNEEPSFKYMGMYIQNDGGNEETITSKLKKAKATTNKTKARINAMKAGKYKVEAIATLRDSVLLGSLLYGVEALSNLTSGQVRELEKADGMFLKEMLELDNHTPDCLVLIHLGLEPISVKVMKRRAIFFKYILDHP